MLSSLIIKNVVLIESLSLSFEGNETDSGLCVFTGETGAGKSIVLDSLGLATGARSDSSLVRKGADGAGATVIATFDVENSHSALKILEEHAISVETPLIVRRTIGKDGRSRAFINDESVSVSLLRKVGESLLEIHGQFDNHSLLNPSYHLDLFDTFGIPPEQGHAIEKNWQEWQEAQVLYNEAKAVLEKAAQEESYLQQSLQDLDALSPEAGEEEKLKSLRQRLMERDKILDALQSARQYMADMESSLGSLYRSCEMASESASSLLQALDRVEAEMQEAAGEMQRIGSDIENEEHNLETIDDRLYALQIQARKHACSIDDLIQKREEIAALINGLENQGDDLEGLSRKVRELRQAYCDQAQKLSNIRQKKAKELDVLITQELTFLKLDKARFETHVTEQEEQYWGSRGINAVQFMVSTNPGMPAGPLNKIASGGEMARFMLALKVVLSKGERDKTIIFDEVDSGIGGATAAAVGLRLSELARHKQILVVTHSPQVAAFGDRHWVVSKSGKTEIQTNVVPLTGKVERSNEIARMISGESITKEAKAAADKLMDHRQYG